MSKEPSKEVNEIENDNYRIIRMKMRDTLLGILMASLFCIASFEYVQYKKQHPTQKQVQPTNQLSTERK